MRLSLQKGRERWRQLSFVWVHRAGPLVLPASLAKGFRLSPRELDLGVIFWGFYFSQMLNKLVM